mmetsp:Transcript_20616/g.59857  ORF Transcript_20616/g.59857 Transcript_20616/m.59857 type:complete len:242 (+) Transcript_20616:1075-1800(+)
MTFLSLKSWCRGQSAIRAMAVVQLGLAMSLADLVASALISGTTRGTLGLYRKADELSMTTAPSSPSAIFSACSRAKSPLTAKKTTSHSLALSTSNNSTSISPNPVSRLDPADRDDPKMRSFPTSMGDFSRHPTISFPTAPVAPTTPTVYPIFRAETAEEQRDDVAWRGAEKACREKVAARDDVDDRLGTNEVDDDGALNASALEADASATRTEAAPESFIYSLLFVLSKKYIEASKRERKR